MFTNIPSLNTQQGLGKSQSALAKSVERLSSGLRINSAADDAAGQAIANRMESRLRGDNQAQRNVADAMSLVATTESAVSDINSILQRMRELAVQKRNGTLSTSDRTSIQTEIDQLHDEINRIGQNTNFGATKLMDVGKQISVQVSSAADGSLPISLWPMNTDLLGLDSFTPPLSDPLDEITIDSGAYAGTWKVAFKGVTVSGVGDLSPEESEAYYGLAPGSITFHQVLNLDDGTPRPNAYAVKVGSTYYYRGAGAANMDFDPDTGTASFRINNAYRQANVRDPDTGFMLDAQVIDNAQLGWDKDGNFVNYLEWNGNYVLSTGARDEYFYLSGPQKNTIELMEPDILEQVDLALKQVDQYRTYLGATQNRLESIAEGLAQDTAILAAAQSRIQDTDYAAEISNMTRTQILQQAGNAVLAQANQIPIGVLSLLQ
ncbi:flagellin [Advenella kashmirensis W13003]|uniref:Flagellin n=1 Tax=Advenella kashmirensis W13003 TaxID=1424334 RepID=V8QVM6_9BURK|nr:flagellin [Advenella kashmirensis W13003]